MSLKFVRFVAAVSVIVSIASSTGVARATHTDRGAPPGVGVQNLELPRALEPHAVGIPPLNIPPASSRGVQFVHIATAANITGGSSQGTIIDHPLTNGKPNAIIIVTPNWNPGGVGGLYDNHPIGVWYSGGTWRIFNQDVAAMPVGAAFNVIIPTAGASVFVHTATVGNSGGNVTTIDNVLTNNKPNALVTVTPNYNPGGVGGTYNSHPIGVYYASGKWRIFNQDIVSMPVNAAFNVSVLTAGAGIFVHTATAANIAFGLTTIDNTLTNGQPNALVFVTPNWNPGGVGGTYDNHNIGVAYDSVIHQWAIVNQGGGTMPLNAAFNVSVLMASADIFVHKATAANIGFGLTSIDNALTNDHPNAIVFVTPNYNPSGVCGCIYDNHNIDVAYDDVIHQWIITNCEPPVHLVCSSASASCMSIVLEPPVHLAYEWRIEMIVLRDACSL